MTTTEHRGSKGVPCPACEHPFSIGRDTRNAGREVYRRRECIACKCRYNTIERVQSGSTGDKPRPIAPKVKKPAPAPAPKETRLAMIKRLAQQHSGL